MAIEMLGAAGMANTMKQFYDKKLLSVAEQNLVFYKYGVKRPIPAKGGKSIEFRRFEKITVTGGSYTLTEGTPPAATQATISSVSATISQYGQFSQISDILDTQGYDPIISEFTDKYGIAMAEGMDIVVRDVLSAATNIQYAGVKIQVGTSGTGAVGSGDYLSAAELREADRTLGRHPARKIDNRWVCFIHPDNKKDLFEDPDIVDAFQLAAPRDENNPLFSGVLGDWGGFRFIESTNVRLRTSYGMSGADVYEVIVLGQEAYGVSELSANTARVIVHPRGSGGHTDPLEQYSTVGWKAALATCILNQNFMLLVNVASSRTPAA